MNSQSVVIVDDNQQWCSALKAEIDKFPLFTVAATIYNGKDAIDYIAKNKPDIITLDLILPEYDGLYIINYIQSELPNYNPFIYILSAIGSDRTNQIVQNMAVDYYSIKPIQAQAVASNLNRLIGNNQVARPAPLSPRHVAVSSSAPEYAGINLSNQIDNYLFEIGAPLNRLSTKCTHSALNLSLSDETKLTSIKSIYRMVGDLSSPPTTIGSIERNIRSTVNNIQKVNNEYFNKCFPGGQKKLTNTQFIDMSVFIIKRRIEEYLSDQVSVRKNSGVYRGER